MRDPKLPLVFLSIWAAATFVCGEKEPTSTDHIDTLFREIGFSPSCVSNTLALCENSAKDSFLLGLALHATLRNVFLKVNELQRRLRNCAEVLHSGDNESGVRTVYPFACEDRSISVFCDQATDGGGWTVIQHREALPVRENFYRDWIEYEMGFGKPDGEFWLGLQNIHALVSNTLMELRVDLEDFQGVKRWAKYSYFHIGLAGTKYLLRLGEYSGNAGDSLAYHSGKPFSTKDQDNDSHDGSCAFKFKGAWWYGTCHNSNLNGYPYEGNHTSYADGINWEHFRGDYYSLKTTSLSLRPKF